MADWIFGSWGLGLSKKKNFEPQIVPRGVHYDGGRSTIAADKAEAINDLMLRSTRKRCFVVSD